MGENVDGPVSLLLPFTWLRAVPFFEALRSPVRFVAVAALGLALLAGFGFARLTRQRARGATLAAAACAAAVLGLESATAFPSLGPSTPPSVYDVVAADPGDFLVVDVPLAFRSGLQTVGITQGAPLAWAATHEQPIAVGFGARTAPWRLDALAATPLYRDLLALQGPAAPVAAPDPAEGRRSALDLGARYVVVSGAYPAVDAYLADVGYLPAGRDGDVALHVLARAERVAEGGG